MYILIISSQERWLKYAGIRKFFSHHSWSPCTKLSEFMVGWLLGGKIYRCFLGSGQEKATFWGLSAFSSFRESFLKRECTVRELKSSGQQLLSVSNAARAECRGGWQCLIQPNTGTSTQGIREEQSYLSSSSHTSAEGHHCQTWKGMDISPHSPASLFTSTNKTLPGSQFLNSLHLLSMRTKEVASSHTPLNTCEGWWHRSIGIILQTCCKTKVLGLIMWDMSGNKFHLNVQDKWSSLFTPVTMSSDMFNWKTKRSTLWKNLHKKVLRQDAFCFFQAVA